MITLRLLCRRRLRATIIPIIPRLTRITLYYRTLVFVNSLGSTTAHSHPPSPPHLSIGYKVKKKINPPNKKPISCEIPPKKKKRRSCTRTLCGQYRDNNQVNQVKSVSHPIKSINPSIYHRSTPAAYQPTFLDAPLRPDPRFSTLKCTIQSVSQPQSQDCAWYTLRHSPL